MKSKSPTKPKILKKKFLEADMSVVSSKRASVEFKDQKEMSQTVRKSVDENTKRDARMSYSDSRTAQLD